jgi:protein-S-isoprenylcysteine O-methyltransferase Ste14
MKSLELKIPPALLMMLFVSAMWLIDYLLPMFKQSWDWHAMVARAIFLMAVSCIIAGVVSFRLAGTTVDPTRPEKATSIVTTGMYRWTRNPMYLGFLLMLLALVIKLSNPATLVFLPMFVLYMNRFQIKPEERVLTEMFGEAYESYIRQVRRWI